MSNRFSSDEVTIRRSRQGSAKSVIAKGLLAMGLVAAVATPIPVAASTGESAVDCSANHCYGIVRWPVAQIHGISATVNVKCLVAPTDTINNFVNAEMWQATAKGQNPDGWVETGMTHGSPRTDRWWFTAHSRPTIPYEEFYIPGGDSLNTNYNMQIQYIGSNTWKIFRDGVEIGTSAQNPGPSARADAGTEMTQSNAMVNATLSNLRYLRTTGTWGTGWSTASYPPSLEMDVPATIKWISKPTSVEFYANRSYCGSGSLADESKPVVSLSDIANRMALANGGAPPKNIRAVRTHQQNLARLQNGIAPSNREVDVVEVSGDFIGYTARVPRGMATPTGKYMYISVDADTKEVVGWSLMNNALSIEQAGVVSQVDK